MRRAATGRPFGVLADDCAVRCLVAALVLPLLLVGCSRGDDPGIAESNLPELVLHVSDLSRGWTRFDEGRQVAADAPPGRRADPGRFGRQNGWKARYRRPGSPATRGPLVIESRADLFADAEGAEADFAALANDLDATVGGPVRRIESPELGDEAVAATATQGTVVFYSVAWRHENVVAALLVNGFVRSLTFADAVRLARRQEQRIAAAAAG